ncbi:MAG: hypothetical protein O2955_12070 [Planctomycetota bacterium]|nr:hypothetical protein [Planctomycetota bacterium]MDA1213248.1 hypothetical protein [Planctomycetota bacterium]
MNEPILPVVSPAIYLADQLETEIDAVFRCGDDLTATRDAVMEVMKHFLHTLREDQRNHEAREKRVKHLASVIRRAVHPALEANYPNDEKYDALKEAFRYIDFVPIPF